MTVSSVRTLVVPTHTQWPPAARAALIRAAASGGSLTAYYEVLGCTASATDQELKSAWRKKCADFHPDKIQAKGLPPEFIEFAKNEMQRINRAYDELRKARGFK